MMHMLDSKVNFKDIFNKRNAKKLKWKLIDILVKHVRRTIPVSIFLIGGKLIDLGIITLPYSMRCISYSSVDGLFLQPTFDIGGRILDQFRNSLTPN